MKKIIEEEGVLKDALCSINQEQVFRFWSELNLSEREHLLHQLKSISVDDCRCALHDMYAKKTQPVNPQPPKFIPALNPLSKKLSDFRNLGEEVLSEGRVAAFTVAGGQGTRLGHNGPKGTYSCTPLSKVSLFEKFAQGLRFCSKRYRKAPWWFIMTSLENHEDTIKYFAKRNFFGVESKRVIFVKQGMMPVFDLDGKILLKEKYEILMSPNGHGGTFRALQDSGALTIMENEGVDFISYFQVDNPMVYCLDPTFIGMHRQAESEMSSKAVQKINASEKVGTFLEIDEKLHVVEYSDIPQEISEQKNDDGSLRFHLGSIAIHMFNRNFIKNISEAKGEQKNRLHFHGALKAVNYLDVAGNYVVGTSPNARKAETFVFDALPNAQNPLLMQIDRNEEFAPIKNANGQDSLESSHKLQLERARKWLKNEQYLQTGEKVEISSLFAPTWPHFVEEISKHHPDPQVLAKKDVILGESGTIVSQN